MSFDCRNLARQYGRAPCDIPASGRRVIKPLDDGAKVIQPAVLQPVAAAHRVQQPQQGASIQRPRAF